jgi:pyridoxal phosphate enzyme (YggS family)
MTEIAIAQNIAKLTDRIRITSQKYKREKGAVMLLAVSKTRPADAIRQAAAAGVEHIGENYLREALDKMGQLQDLELCWHFIGPIQSNKTRAIAEHFDWVHSIDRAKIARRLNEQRPADLPPLQVCLQVNISGEDSKSGAAPADIRELAAVVESLPKLTLRGLMAIPAATDNPQQQRQAFAALRELLEHLQPEHLHMDTLSMGMSADLEAAIAEGATIVRVGTDIFGPRDG